MILHWDQPKKAMPVQEWKERYGFEGGPAGGYQPNMSDDDRRKWKAKITGKKLGYPQVEIRRTVGMRWDEADQIWAGGVQLLVIVNLGKGYKYKQYTPEKDSWGGCTAGFNIHIALNGGGQMTFEEMNELHQAVDEARQALIELEKENKDE